MNTQRSSTILADEGAVWPNSTGTRPVMKEEADLARMARTRMAAWRLMGDAFEQLLRSSLTDRPERVQALAIAEWLYTNYLTDGQKLQFIVDAGWIMGSEL